MTLVVCVRKRPKLTHPLFYRRNVQNKIKIQLIFIVCLHLCQWRGHKFSVVAVACDDFGEELLEVFQD